MSTPDTDDDSGEDRLFREFVVGFVAGIAVWLLGYAITYLWRASAVEGDLRDAVLAYDRDVTVEGIGWLFYNAHYVSTVHTQYGGIEVFRVNIIAESGGALYLLAALPPILLLAAGAITAVRADSVGTDIDCVRAGTMVISGYLPLSAIAPIAFTVRVGPELTRPDPVTAVLLAGVVYPIAFGALGGLLARYVLARRAKTSKNRSSQR